MHQTLSKKSSTNFFLSSKNSFQESGSNLRMTNSQTLSNLRVSQSPKISLLEINKQKVKKRNSQLLKLFKSNQHQNFNIEMLQRSQHMKNNQIFYYLVKALKKQRQGMINVNTIQEQKIKEPKPIENKIRQFLYQSLQESLLMSQKQLKSTKYFERLFQWFTDVFKQRQMKLEFKKQNNNKKQTQIQDQDWIIRNTYKSNMPLQLSNYQRKLLNGNQINQFNQKFIRHNKNQQTPQNNKENQPNTSNMYPVLQRNRVQKKLFAQSSPNSPTYQKSKEILPLLNRKNLLSKLNHYRQEKQQEQLKNFKLQWKRAKAHFDEHLTLDFNQKNKFKKQNFGNKTFVKNCQKLKDNSLSFSLEPKVLQRIQAAKLGVTFTEFRKNKQKILKQNINQNNQIRVFHPYLTTNHFHEIKKKRLQQIKKLNFEKKSQYNQSTSKNTQESQQINPNNTQNLTFDDEFQIGNIREKNSETIDSIDGLGLSLNPLQKGLLKNKKK